MLNIRETMLPFENNNGNSEHEIIMIYRSAKWNSNWLRINSIWRIIYRVVEIISVLRQNVRTWSNSWEFKRFDLDEQYKVITQYRKFWWLAPEGEIGYILTLFAFVNDKSRYRDFLSLITFWTDLYKWPLTDSSIDLINIPEQGFPQLLSW